MFDERQFLINKYLELTKQHKCPVAELDGGLVYYYADKIGSNIYINGEVSEKIIEIDVKSAFPTICKFLYGPNHWFVKKIYEFDNKFDRNKYIAVTLTHNKSPDLKYKINDLNIWSKVIVLTYCYSYLIDPFLLELKKDGIVVTCKEVNPETNDVLDLLYELGFKFHSNFIDQYLRYHRTSIYAQSKELTIKGTFKNPPNFVKSFLKQVLNNNNLVYNNDFLYNIKNIYSKLYFDILILKGLYTDIEDKYEFAPLKFINSEGKLQHLKSIYECKDVIVPEQYLYNVIYPVIALLK